MSGRSNRPGDWAIGVVAPHAPRPAAALAVESLVLLDLVGRVMGAGSNAARLRALCAVEDQLAPIAQCLIGLRMSLEQDTPRSASPRGDAP